ncbi:hypothetical protein O3P69_019915 [Scylla paramamosain]|uniref:Uncharacterized protein n=1 Tax=Scylla paramamosain TaxID=85552 RepID=A0AAW0SID1_SCYPA
MEKQTRTTKIQCGVGRADKQGVIDGKLSSPDVAEGPEGDLGHVTAVTRDPRENQREADTATAVNTLPKTTAVNTLLQATAVNTLPKTTSVNTLLQATAVNTLLQATAVNTLPKTTAVNTLLQATVVMPTGEDWRTRREGEERERRREEEERRRDEGVTRSREKKVKKKKKKSFE